MKLEKWSWFAGIVAAIVATLAWLVDRNDAIKFCKDWGKTIISPFVFAFNWLTHPVTWPIWALILLVFLGLLLWLIGTCLNKQSLSPAQRAQGDFHNFTRREIEGVVWKWNYFGNRINDSALAAFCPKPGCMNRLESDFSPENPNRHAGLVPPDTMKCNRCGFIKHFDRDYDTLKRHVMDEIERLIETGQYVEQIT